MKHYMILQLNNIVEYFNKNLEIAIKKYAEELLKQENTILDEEALYNICTYTLSYQVNNTDICK